MKEIKAEVDEEVQRNQEILQKMVDENKEKILARKEQKQKEQEEINKEMKEDGVADAE